MGGGGREVEVATRVNSLHKVINRKRDSSIFTSIIFFRKLFAALIEALRVPPHRIGVKFFIVVHITAMICRITTRWDDLVGPRDIYRMTGNILAAYGEGRVSFKQRSRDRDRDSQAESGIESSWSTRDASLFME